MATFYRVFGLGLIILAVFDLATALVNAGVLPNTIGFLLEEVVGHHRWTHEQGGHVAGVWFLLRWTILSRCVLVVAGIYFFHARNTRVAWVMLLPLGILIADYLIVQNRYIVLGAFSLKWHGWIAAVPILGILWGLRLSGYEIVALFRPAGRASYRGLTLLLINGCLILFLSYALSPKRTPNALPIQMVFIPAVFLRLLLVGLMGSLWSISGIVRSRSLFPLLLILGQVGLLLLFWFLNPTELWKGFPGIMFLW